MATTIGKLSVVLTARTGKFQRAMRKAGDVAKRASIAIGAAGTAAAAGIVAITVKQLAATDALAKNADRIGVSTEALAGLQRAAELAGISNEKMNKSLQNMNRRIGESKRGMGQAVAAFKALGLSADDLSKLPADEAMARITDALNGVENQALKSSLAFDIFGRTGVDLFTLFKTGGDGIRQSADEAKKFGLAISRVDAAKVEAANDAVSDLRRVFSGIGRQLAVSVAPVIKLVADRFTNAATAGGGIGSKVRGAVSVALLTIANLLDSLADLRTGFKTLGAQILVWKADALDAFSTVLKKAAEFSKFLPGTLSIVSAPALAASVSTANAAQSARNSAAKVFNEIAAGGGGSAAADSIRKIVAEIIAPGGASGQRPPTEQKQEETNKKLDTLINTVERQTDAMTRALGELSGGDTKSLLRVLDRLTVVVSSSTVRQLPGAIA